MFISFEKQQQPEEMKKLQETLEIICIALRSSNWTFSDLTFSTKENENDAIIEILFLRFKYLHRHIYKGIVFRFT